MGTEEVAIGASDPNLDSVELWFDSDAESIYAVGAPGPVGPMGPQGPQGLQGGTGPQGQTGSSSTLFEYKYNTGSSPPPALSSFRTDGIDAATSTIFWVHRQDSGNVDRKPVLMIGKAGAKLYVQDVGNSDAFATYHLTADPIDNGDYITFNVALDSNGGTPLAGGNNKPCLLGVIAPGPVGPQGPAGPQGPQGAQGVWVQMTRAAYTALAVKDPNVLYVIVG